MHYIVFNLYKIADHLYLPNAFIVKESIGGGLGYIEQKATLQTVPSFDLDLSTEQKLLLSRISQISEDQIAQKYSPNPKKPVSLAELMKHDPKTLAPLKKHIWSLVSDILFDIKKFDQYLTIEMPRKDEAKRYLVEVFKGQVAPKLFFKLKDYGILYKMQIRENQSPITLWESDLKVLSNQPAWVVINQKLYTIKHIKGLMLKPFQAKEQVYIPPKSIMTYFQQFILKVAANVEIDAQGFDVESKSTFQNCSLEIVEDIFSNEWVLTPKMHYNENTHFLWHSPKAHKLALNTDKESIKVIKIERNPQKENQKIEALKAFGLKENPSGNFYLSKQKGQDVFALHQWLINAKKELEDKGFIIEPMDVDQREISPFASEIQIEVDEQNDWFDIKGMVYVGKHCIAFVKFIPYLKNKERFYPLPDGTFMIIPSEWMTHYSEIATFAKLKDGVITLTKSQYPLLEKAKLIRKARAKKAEIDLTQLYTEKLKASLRPYQLEGVHWMIQLNQKGLGGCLADDMGLGKTLQTISTLLYAKAVKEKHTPEKALVAASDDQLDLFSQTSDHSESISLKALIILPASLVFNWQAELKKFTPSLSVLAHVGMKRKKDPQYLSKYDVVLTTYHTALRDFDVLDALVWEYIVLDESQQIKNKDGKVFRSISRLKANNKLALSGTPIENSLSDLWAQMQFINPNLLGGFSFFREEFIKPIEKQANEERKEALYDLVKPYLLRRTKFQVAKDLPDLTTKVFYSDMLEKQDKFYQAEKSAIRNYLLNIYDRKKGAHHMHMLQSLMKLRQLANHTSMAGYEPHEGGKFHDVIHHWNTITKSGHKVLIFSSFVKHLELFKTYFEEQSVPFALLHGSLTAKEKKKQIEYFESNKKVKTFLISIKAGGTGLNLTSADYVFILDPWWNPFVEKQAIARAHRIGQKKNVMAIKFVTKGTIEEKIIRLQEKKTALAEDIIKENTKIPLDPKLLDSLL